MHFIHQLFTQYCNCIQGRWNQGGREGIPAPPPSDFCRIKSITCSIKRPCISDCPIRFSDLPKTLLYKRFHTLSYIFNERLICNWYFFRLENCTQFAGVVSLCRFCGLLIKLKNYCHFFRKTEFKHSKSISIYSNTYSFINEWFEECKKYIHCCTITDYQIRPL